MHTAFIAYSFSLGVYADEFNSSKQKPYFCCVGLYKVVKQLCTGADWQKANAKLAFTGFFNCLLNKGAFEITGGLQVRVWRIDKVSFLPIDFEPIPQINIMLMWAGVEVEVKLFGKLREEPGRRLPVIFVV